MKNVLKEKMLAGERTLGTFFETGSTTVAQCLGLAGLDYIIIDNEHGPFNPQSTLEYVRAAKLYGLTPLARVSEISRPSLSYSRVTLQYPSAQFVFARISS